MLVLVVEEFPQQLLAHQSVMRQAVVVLFTGMVAMVVPVVLALRQTQLLVALVEKVAWFQTLH
jgi:hypothetical protein